MKSTLHGAQEILSAPKFKQLRSERAKLRWGLSVATLVMFFGFIALISTARNTLGLPLASLSIPLGLFLAMSMIIVVVMLTGFYVYRCNSRFDELASLLNREFGQ